MSKRILTGIQPSGILHIGNYFGAMRSAIELQNQNPGNTFLFIADLHSLTVNPDPADLRTRIQRLALDFLACGLDPEKTAFFRQSDIQGVCELSWILNTITNLGMLERAHSYKDKVAKGFVPNNGLFSYPVLMAADILIYKSDLVPVGKDQKQHLEITRDLAIRFNQMYKKDVFTIPEPIISESVAVVPGTDGQKMSKSYNNTIELFGEEKAIRKKSCRSRPIPPRWKRRRIRTSAISSRCINSSPRRNRSMRWRRNTGVAISVTDTPNRHCSKPTWNSSPRCANAARNC